MLKISFQILMYWANIYLGYISVVTVLYSLPVNLLSLLKKYLLTDYLSYTGLVTISYIVYFKCFQHIMFWVSERRCLWVSVKYELYINRSVDKHSVVCFVLQNLAFIWPWGGQVVALLHAKIRPLSSCFPALWSWIM